MKPKNKFELHLMMNSVEQGMEMVGAANGEWKPQGFKEMTDDELREIASMLTSANIAFSRELELRKQSRNKAN